MSMSSAQAVLTRAREAPFPVAMPKDRERALKDRYLPAIRELAATQFAPDDVIVRGMLLCSSERDYYYTRFSLEALDQVAGMLPGRPVMMGHDYSTLPIGRFFQAERKLIPQGKKPMLDSYW